MRAIVGSLLVIAVLCIPSSASAYVHVAACQQALRGNPGDDDVHDFGVSIRAGYGIFSDAGRHYNDNNVIVQVQYGAFGAPYNPHYVEYWNGYCTSPRGAGDEAIVDKMSSVPVGWWGG